ncbi:MAG: glycosyltransferase [Comamonadaceae bacterium]|nr:MAG: glycosyltransferase [Comamonadaceae bacterium]
MAAAPQVTVSIVSHGQAALVRKLVANLHAVSAHNISRLVITLNIAESDMLEDLPALFPCIGIERIVNPVRKGFGANHNQAFRRFETPWFLVLNPDMHFDTDVLAPLTAKADARSGLLAPRIYEPGKTSPEQHRATITPQEIIMRRRPGYAIPAVPQWIPGLFMLFRSQAYRQVDGFDERFFMYGEDFDICARVQLAGWKLQIGEDLSALHDARRASHASPQYLYWHVMSLLRIWGSRVFWRFQNQNQSHHKS